MGGWGRGGLFRPFCPFCPGSERKVSPATSGIHGAASARPPRFSRSEPWWEKKLKCFGEGGAQKPRKPLLPGLGPLSLLIVGVSTSEAGFSGLRGAPALPEQKRTKGRRPCWHHDAASLPPAARALPVLPAALAPPSQTRVLFSGSEQSRRLGRGRGRGRGKSQGGTAGG